MSDCRQVSIRFLYKARLKFSEKQFELMGCSHLYKVRHRPSILALILSMRNGDS